MNRDYFKVFCVGGLIAVCMFVLDGCDGSGDIGSSSAVTVRSAEQSLQRASVKSGYQIVAVNKILNYKGQFVAGFDDGSISQEDLSGWTQWLGPGRGPVNALINYGDSIVAGFADGAVLQYKDDQMRELQGIGWNSPVNSMVIFHASAKEDDKFVIAQLGNGALERWNDLDGHPKYWTELKNAAWQSAGTMVVYHDPADEMDKLIIGHSDGSVDEWEWKSDEGISGKWNRINQSGGSMITYSSVYHDPGVNIDTVIIGRMDGTVDEWNGKSRTWQRLIDGKWSLPIRKMIEFRGDLIVGLGDDFDSKTQQAIGGAVKKWDGKNKNWTELRPSLKLPGSTAHPMVVDMLDWNNRLVVLTNDQPTSYWNPDTGNWINLPIDFERVANKVKPRTVESVNGNLFIGLESPASTTFNAAWWCDPNGTSCMAVGPR